MAVAPPAPKIDSTDQTRAKGRLHDSYFWHRLHSASGIFPIGVFLLQHMIANSYALRGPVAYNTVVKVFGYLPFVTVLEFAVIYIPILFHSLYGFFITAYGQANLGRYGYGRNWLYFMQRASGVVAFAYIGFHIYNTSWQKYQHGEVSIQYQAMAHQMATPAYFAAYLIGITATVFHFTNGLWNFCIRWGITISARSQRLMAYACWGMFAVFTLIGIATANSLRAAGLAH